MTLRPKPLLGDPCNRCGLCCTLGPCGAARLVLKQESGRCAVLMADGLGGYICGLGRLLDAPAFAEAMAIATGAGIGCDMTQGPEDIAVRPTRIPKMVQAARAARRAATPAAEMILQRLKLSPP